MAFLGLDAQGCDWARFESHQADRLAGIFAITVGAILKARQRRVDLGNQLALPITRPESTPRPVSVLARSARSG